MLPKNNPEKCLAQVRVEKFKFCVLVSLNCVGTRITASTHSIKLDFIFQKGWIFFFGFIFFQFCLIWLFSPMPQLGTPVSGWNVHVSEDMCPLPCRLGLLPYNTITPPIAAVQLVINWITLDVDSCRQST